VRLNLQVEVGGDRFITVPAPLPATPAARFFDAVHICHAANTVAAPATFRAAVVAASVVLKLPAVAVAAAADVVAGVAATVPTGEGCQRV
jgi:hypothetical protein